MSFRLLNDRACPRPSPLHCVFFSLPSNLRYSYNAGHTAVMVVDSGGGGGGQVQGRCQAMGRAGLSLDVQDWRESCKQTEGQRPTRALGFCTVRVEHAWTTDRVIVTVRRGLQYPSTTRRLFTALESEIELPSVQALRFACCRYV